MIRHLLAILGLGLLCAGWVKVQLWAERDRLEAGSRSARCHGLCAPEAQPSCVDENCACVCQGPFVDRREITTHRHPYQQHGQSSD
jgi:hypothetical protein